MDRASPDPALLAAASRMIPAYGVVLAIGPDTPAIRPFLPPGCTLLTADRLPDATIADLLFLTPPPETAGALASAATRLGKPMVCATSASAATTLVPAMREAGFRLQCSEIVQADVLLKWVPGGLTALRSPRVLVLSHYHIANFGDRLGYHLLNSVLPAEAEVTYGTFRPWAVPEGDYDLLVIGIGNSLLPKDAANPELARLLDRIPHAIGIFGTQYRDQFVHFPVARDALARILDRVDTWWARYEEDIFAFGRDRPNVRHLGDWLVAAAPMAWPRIDKSLHIPAEIYEQEVALDRMIQRIQSYRAISSGRLHTLLAALPSADQVAYQEQRQDERFRVPGSEADGKPISGKFRSLLYDVFGRTFEEDQPFHVDRPAVIAYKRKVQANMEALRADLFALLGCKLPSA